MQRMESRSIWLFLVLFVLLSAVFYAVPLATGKIMSGNRLYLTGLMWSPGLAAILTCWLRGLRGLRSGSLWTAAVMHASHNLFIQAFFTPMTGASGGITPYAIDEFGFVLPLVMVALAFWFWLRRDEAVRAAA